MVGTSRRRGWTTARGCRRASRWWPGVGFGALLGWALDRWLGTMPLFLIVFFMLGAAAGVLNAYRHLRRMQNGA